MVLGGRILVQNNENLQTCEKAAGMFIKLEEEEEEDEGGGGVRRK